MTKVSLRTLDSVTNNDTTATALINENFRNVQAAIENTLSRDGSVPNYMDANFDLNSKRIINLGDPVDDYDAITKKYFTDTIGDAASYATAAAVSANSAASSAQSSAVSAAQAIAELQQAEATINAAVQQAVNTASGQAAADIANYVNTVVEPSLQNIASMAQGYSNNSSNYANLAMAWASQPSGTVDGSEYSAKYYAGLSKDWTNVAHNYSNSSSGYANNSSNYANSSLGYANNSSNYANSSLSSSTNASNYANNASIWAEGTDEQVQALGGQHSSKTWASFGKYYVGQIVESPLPITDASLHLLDGSLLAGGGIYDDFVTYVAGLVSTYPDCFTTEAAWQQSVTDYGVCGKFVYDSVNNTVRLPKYLDKIYTSSIDTVAPVKVSSTEFATTGNTLKLRNKNGNSIGNTGNQPLGIATNGDALTVQTSVGTTSTQIVPTNLYSDLSNITAPVEGYYYIVVAISVKTDIEVDIDEIATDLNGKVDVDLSNMNASQTAKETIVGWSMPDFTAAVSITFNSSMDYTAPCDGYIHLKGNNVAADLCAPNGGGEVKVEYWYSTTYSSTCNPIVKGYRCKYRSGSSSSVACIFYPLKGVN